MVSKKSVFPWISGVGDRCGRACVDLPDDEHPMEQERTMLSSDSEDDERSISLDDLLFEWQLDLDANNIPILILPEPLFFF